MTQQEVETSYNSVVQTNNKNYVNASALRMRLDTSPIIESIELFLRGAKIVIMQDESGGLTSRKMITGTPKANDEGIQTLLNYITSVFNTAVVQGNFPSDSKGVCRMYDDYIEEINEELVKSIINNLYEWEIKEDDVDIIVDFVMKLTIPFMTRLIDNKERESYGESLTQNTVDRVRSVGDQKSPLTFFKS